MRFAPSPIVRQATSALVAAALLSAPVDPAFASIGELLPQKVATASPNELAPIKDDNAAAGDVTINLNKPVNLGKIIRSFSPLDPVKTIDGAVRELPKSIGVTLPVVNIPLRVDLGIYVRKVTPAEVASSDVVVNLPKDLKKAASLAAAGDVQLALKSGGSTSRFDIDAATPRKGAAEITVVSKAIPKLPLQKSAPLGRFCATCGNGEEISNWFVVKNLKNDVSFYTNLVTGVSQFNAPPGF